MGQYQRISVGHFEMFFASTNSATKQKTQLTKLNGTSSSRTIESTPKDRKYYNKKSEVNKVYLKILMQSIYIGQTQKSITSMFNEHVPHHKFQKNR